MTPLLIILLTFTGLSQGEEIPWIKQLHLGQKLEIQHQKSVEGVNDSLTGAISEIEALIKKVKNFYPTRIKFRTYKRTKEQLFALLKKTAAVTSAPKVAKGYKAISDYRLSSKYRKLAYAWRDFRNLYIEAAPGPITTEAKKMIASIEKQRRDQQILRQVIEEKAWLIESFSKTHWQKTGKITDKLKQVQPGPFRLRRAYDASYLQLVNSLNELKDRFAKARELVKSDDTKAKTLHSMGAKLIITVNEQMPYYAIELEKSRPAPKNELKDLVLEVKNWTKAKEIFEDHFRGQSLIKDSLKCLGTYSNYAKQWFGSCTIETKVNEKNGKYLYALHATPGYLSDAIDIEFKMITILEALPN